MDDFIVCGLSETAQELEQKSKCMVSFPPVDETVHFDGPMEEMCLLDLAEFL